MPQTPAIPAPPSPQDVAAQTHGLGTTDAASPELVDKFLALDEPSRTKLMSGWDDTRKRYMLAGLQARKPKESTTAPPDSIVGGFGRRAVQTVKGAYDTFKPPETTGDKIAMGVAGPGGLAAKRIGQGAYEAGKRKVTQTAEDIAAGHPLKAALHGIESDPTSVIGPLSPMQSQADLVEQGRYREALGSAAFDAFSYWLGGKLGGAVSKRMAANKLAAATGGDVDPIREVMPDLADTAKQHGAQPRTIQDAQQLVSDTTDHLSAEFDRDFAPIAKNRIYTPVIKQRLGDILAKNPQWKKTPEGRAKISAINDAIATYDKTGWTFEEMNKERGDLRGQIRALNKQAPSDAAARIRHDADVAAKSAVADVMSDTVNDWLSHQTGKPKAYYDALRQKQARLIDLEDTLDTRVTELHNKQAAHEAAGPIGRFKLHAYVSPSSSGFLRAHASGLHDALSAGPEAAANAQVRAAFKSSKHPIASAAVKSLPVDALTERDREDVKKATRRSAIAPPPEPPE